MLVKDPDREMGIVFSPDRGPAKLSHGPLSVDFDGKTIVAKRGRKKQAIDFGTATRFADAVGGA